MLYGYRRGLWTRIAASGTILSLLAWALAIGLVPGFSSLAPVAHAQPNVWLQPELPEHALPTHYDPAQNAVLKVPPIRVQITFSEHLNPDLSKIVVVNPSNQEVDNRDRQISADAYTMTVTLPLLPAGTYVVFWGSHSADDGHIAGGSYIFHIARADGTVPPLTGPLPSGSIVGGAGLAQGNDVTGTSILAAMFRWLGLLALTLLLGMFFWWVVVQPRQHMSQTLTAELGRLMRWVARLALVLVLIATLLEVAAQAVTLSGIQGVTSLPLLGSILWNSRFGHAILARAALALIGLLVLWRWEEALLLGPKHVGNRRVLLLAYGLVLALAFEYSGHGGSAPTWWGPLIDYLHLLANGVWLGSLMCLAVVVIPALLTRSSRERQGYLAASIAAFSIPALLAVAFVIVTGPLNATVRMTSIEQLWTTPYGILLLVKAGLFLGMAAISYYHAFVLRPRLVELTQATGVTESGSPPAANGRLSRVPIIGKVARELGSEVLTRASPSAISSLSGGLALSPGGTELAEKATELFELNLDIRIGRADGAGNSAGKRAEALAQVIMRWLRFEAALGVGILLCAALLAPLAGTLAPSPTRVASFGATGGAQTFTHEVDGLEVTLSVSPGKFGTNTFTVLVKKADGAPVNNANLFIETTMVEMDMGTNTINLTPAATAGTYSGKGELPMAGHWRLEVVIRTQEDPNVLHSTTFTIGASF
jgi:copper transport protein